jgi:hypothetical protein
VFRISYFLAPMANAFGNSVINVFYFGVFYINVDGVLLPNQNDLQLYEILGSKPTKRRPFLALSG